MIPDLDGEQLYRIYNLEMLKHGTETDEWEDLDETEQDTWQAVADHIRRSYIP